MNWNRLLSDKRLGLEGLHSNSNEVRSDFERDYDRMIFSSPFRRLQNKTQVFPLPGSIFVHNRLTHSLEVASVGRSMANGISRELQRHHAREPWADKLASIGDIVAAACLCHDIGNPPFGHSGEKTISAFFSEGAGSQAKGWLNEHQWSDLIRFEGNANSFRLLTHQFEGRRQGGFAMTYATLGTIVKYPYSSQLAGEKGKFGFFSSEEETFRTVAAELGMEEKSPGRFMRHPLVYIVEAADDICYQIMDIEDAHRLKILSTELTMSLLLSYFDGSSRSHITDTLRILTDPNEKVAYLRSKVIGALVADCTRLFIANERKILEGNYTGSLISHLSYRLSEGYARCSQATWEHIYGAPEVVDIEIAGNRILSYLMEVLFDAVMNPDKTSSRLILAKIPQQYCTRGKSIFARIQGALDHISGMTDVYALDLYRKLNGLSLPAV